MSVRLLIAGTSQETGALLTEYLQERQVFNPDSPNVVCYGLSTRVVGAVALNRYCNLDKIDRMYLMNRGGVRMVPWFEGKDIPEGIQFPLLARKSMGFGGTDIVPVFQPKEVAWRVAAGWEWFSSYVPVETEFRVWVFRDLHLDTYEKVMKRETEYRYIGRNFRNGFEFQKTEQREAATWQAVSALKALKLDFGAVDMVLGEDGKIYVLEVNTAPGVIRSGAQGTLAKLADQIKQWDEKGYPTWE